MQNVYYSLYSKLLNRTALMTAFKKVKSAGGAPGVDGETVACFHASQVERVDELLHELHTKTYRPLPVREVEIPKDDGGIRTLGIPAVKDRVVQQALLNILEPLFDKGFHPSSYGYRKKRSCHQAITKATLFMRQYKLTHVVDMDMSKCFDTLDHDLILTLFRKKIADGSILNLLKMFLKSGVMTQYEFKPKVKGSPQGGVISPLIANVYLNEFDQFAMKRNWRIVRYADDILILCRSKCGAEKAMKTARYFLEKKLKLTVNAKKTHLTTAYKGVKFLGVVIRSNYTSILDDKIAKLKTKVKMMTKRNNSYTLKVIIRNLNRVLMGFVNYFRIANCKGILVKLMSWIRRRIRAVQLKHWKKPAKLHRRLRQLGYKGEFDYIKMNSWRNAGCPLAHYAMPNKWLHEEMRLYDMTKIENGIFVPLPE